MFKFLIICGLVLSGTVCGGLSEKVKDDVDYYYRLSDSRARVCELVEELDQNGIVERSGRDSSFQAIFLNVFSVIKRDLLEHSDNITAVIHRNGPAWALCHESNGVQGRMMQQMLNRGIKIYSVYPNDSWKGKSPEEREYYQTLLEKHASLRDIGLEARTLPSDMVGMSYFFERNGEKWFFGLQAPVMLKGLGSWKMWYGPEESSEIGERSQRVKKFLHSSGLSLN